VRGNRPRRSIWGRPINGVTGQLRKFFGMFLLRGARSDIALKPTVLVILPVASNHRDNTMPLPTTPCSVAILAGDNLLTIARASAYDLGISRHKAYPKVVLDGIPPHLLSTVTQSALSLHIHDEANNVVTFIGCKLGDMTNDVFTFFALDVLDRNGGSILPS
jgi:hypothetical protein